MTGGKERKHILIVDDGVTDLALICERLSSHYEPSVSNRVEDALRLLENTNPYYFVLTDLVMPEQDQNGIDLIRAMRTKPYPVPVIAMSASATPKTIHTATKEGAILLVDKDELKTAQTKEGLQKILAEMEKEVELYHREYADRQKEHQRANYDHLGHAYTDRNILENLGTVIRGNLHRAIDRGYRFGGDEFVVVLPETSAAGALEVAKNIVQQYDSLRSKFTYTRYKSLTPTPVSLETFEQYRPYGSLSVGIAETPSRKEITRERLVEMADIAMYHAKREGKASQPPHSCIKLYEPHLRHPPGREELRE